MPKAVVDHMSEYEAAFALRIIAVPRAGIVTRRQNLCVLFVAPSRREIILAAEIGDAAKIEDENRVDRIRSMYVQNMIKNRLTAEPKPGEQDDREHGTHGE